jgi:type IV pilus biogenesis protein PilP
MQSKHIIGLFALSVCLAMPARAETTSQTLTRLEAETMLLKARERQLEVQASIVGKQNEIAAKQSMTAAMTQAEVVGDPMVRAIEGIGGRVYATLQMNDGSIVEVQRGDKLPGGMRIVSIGPGAVIAQAGERRIRLAQYTSNPGFNPGFSIGAATPARGAMK